MTQQSHIITIGNIKDLEIRKVLQAMKEQIEILSRRRGEIEDSSLTVQDLVTLGLIGVDDNDNLYNPNAASAPAFSQSIMKIVASSGGLTVSDADTRYIRKHEDLGEIIWAQHRLWIWDNTTSLWYSIVLVTVDGVRSLDVGAVGVANP